MKFLFSRIDNFHKYLVILLTLLLFTSCTQINPTDNNSTDSNPTANKVEAHIESVEDVEEVIEIETEETVVNSFPPPVIKILNGQVDDCSAATEDIRFIGTEPIFFTTCIADFQAINRLYLVANKPTSVVERDQGVWQYFERSIPPQNNVPVNLFHAFITLTEPLQYFGLDVYSTDQEFLNVGGFDIASEKYVYINREGGDTTTFQNGNSQLRWRINKVENRSNELIIFWELQLLDINYLRDEVYGFLNGTDKNLEIYAKVDHYDWNGPLSTLRRRGDFLYTGINNAKDHTFFEKDDQFYIISMRNDIQKTYMAYEFNFEKADGSLNLARLMENNTILSSDFDLEHSDLFCRLSAPHMNFTSSAYSYYFSIFGKENTENCQLLGQQYIYSTERTEWNEFSMADSKLLIDDGRDPYVVENSMFYTHAHKPEIRVRELLTGEDEVVFTAEDVWIDTSTEHWPESPSLVDDQGLRYLFFSARTTAYLVELDGQWYYQGYLSIPRNYEWLDIEIDPITDNPKRRFWGLNWAAEFWPDDQNNVLSSFVSVYCKDIVDLATCVQNPILMGYINFDLYHHPYLSVLPLQQPEIEAEDQIFGNLFLDSHIPIERDRLLLKIYLPSVFEK